MSIGGIGSDGAGFGMPPEGGGFPSTTTPPSTDGKSPGGGVGDKPSQGSGSGASETGADGSSLGLGVADKPPGGVGSDGQTLSTGSGVDGSTATAGGKVVPHDMGQLLGLIMGALGGNISEEDVKAFQAGEDSGFDAWSGMDTISNVLDDLVVGGLQSLSQSEINSQLGGSAGKDLVRLMSNPKLAAADQSQVNNDINSSDVWKLVATVLGQLAQIAQRDKVIEARVTEKAEEGKSQNRAIDQVQMIKMKAIKNAQAAKAKKLKKHGKVMKATMIAATVLMAVVAAALIVIMAAIAIVAIVVTGGTATFIVIAIIAVVIAAAVMLTATAATTAANLALQCSGAMEPGGLVDQLIEALGLEATEFMRALANMLIMIALGCVNILASLVVLPLALLQAPAQAAQTLVMQLIMLFLNTVMMVLGAFIGSGMMDFLIRETCMAMGMDEEDAQRVSMITNMVVTVAMMVASIAIMVGGLAAGAGGGVKGGSSTKATAPGAKAPGSGPQGAGPPGTGSGAQGAQKAGKMARFNEKFGKILDDAMDKIDELDIKMGGEGGMSAQHMKGTQRAASSMEYVMNIMEGITGVLEATFTIVRGVVAIKMGKLQKEMGELEAEKAAIQYIMDLVEIMNAVLGATIQTGLDLMEAVTEDTARNMELGNQIWNSLSRAGSAINTNTLA